MSDEPKFTLRAQDKFAPELIEQWAALVEAEDSRTVDDKNWERQQKIRAARALAHQMRAWQVLNRCKLPD